MNGLFSKSLLARVKVGQDVMIAAVRADGGAEEDDKMTMRFATRQFVLTYKQGKNHVSNQAAFYGSLRAVLKSVFGTSYRITQRFCYIQAPIDCCFYALNAVLIQEFRKQPELKGMQFRLDLREGLARV